MRLAAGTPFVPALNMINLKMALDGAWTTL